MVCYICNNPASAQCPWCHRYICAAHTYGGWGGVLCNNCNNLKPPEAETKRLQEKIEKGRWCDFCGKLVGDAEFGNICESKFLAYGTYYSCLPKCHICQRSYCSKHGQIIYIRRIPGSESWYRCIDHLKKPGILGRRELTGFFNYVFSGKADREESGY